VVRIGLNNKTNNRRLDWDINTPTPYNLTRRLDWDINTAPHSPPTQSAQTNTGSGNPHETTRAYKTAKGHRCQARMQSIQQLRLPKAADRRTKRKADRQPEVKGLNRSSLPSSRHRAAPTSNLDPPPSLRFLPDLRNILDHEEGRFASCYRCRAISPDIAASTSRCKTPSPPAYQASRSEATAEGKAVAETNFRSDVFRKGVTPP
jgi:hypothetical protein